MSILSDFEDRMANAVEGLFAGAFRSPVQPAEVAKALAKAMDDGRVVGVGKVYAPTVYTVALSPEDAGKLGTFTDTLSGELSIYLSDHARERDYVVPVRPFVRFDVHDDLKMGRFRVSAELTSAQALASDALAAEEAATPGAAGVGPPASATPPPPLPSETSVIPRVPSRRRSSRGVPGIATVTVGETHHDVALRGDRIVVGRLKDCDLCLSDANASRRHAAFLHDASGWSIEDLESTNGTRVNGQPIASVRLRDGDVIEIGVTRLVFHEPRS